MDPGRRALITALLGACAANGSTPAGPDAAIPTCAETSATIGRCRVAGTGADCTGVPGEAREFLPLEPGSELQGVVGPQGSEMFVLALRAGGIDPGDPDDPTSATNPEVDITLVRQAAPMALYRGRPGFSPVAGEPDLYEVAGLFVVTDGDDVDGELLHAVARIVDAGGAERCGTADFVAASP
jgi:hypothetical protein